MRKWRTKGTNVVTVCHPHNKPHAALDQDGVLVLYKPAFWTVTTSGTKKGDRMSKAPQLQDYLRDTFGKQYPYLVSDFRAGCVHRLDIQTSGPILVGTNEKAFNEMRSGLRTHAWYKEYLALMHGAVPPNRCCGVMDFKLFTKQDGQGWRTEVNNKKGEAAETRFECITAYRGKSVTGGQSQRFTLVRLQLITGKTHQIRVHLQALAKQLGLPVHGIVGDYKYLPQSQVRNDRRICARVFLHAHRLHFPKPGKGRDAGMHRIICPLPPELQKALNCLQKDERTTEQFRLANRDRSPLTPVEALECSVVS